MSFRNDGHHSRFARQILQRLMAGCMALFVCLAVSVVRADEAPAGTHKDTATGEEAKRHEGEKHEEHPAEGPITAKGAEVDLAVWSLITFGIFLAVLGKFAWGPMIAGLDKRESGVLQNISDAESARRKAERLLAEHAAKLDRVQDEIREILAEARRDAEHTKNEIIAVAQRESDATRLRAVQDIERARDQALSDLFGHMSRSIEEATEKVVGRALSGADQDRLVEEALAGLTRQGNR